MKALSSGSFQPCLSGFLWLESFISGVREAQGSFPLAVNALSIMESALCPPPWKSAAAGGLCLEFLAESGEGYSGSFVLPEAEAGGEKLKPLSPFCHHPREQTLDLDTG